MATQEHNELFSHQLDKLGADLPALMAAKQLVFLDAQGSLNLFMRAGQPDWALFEKTIGTAMRHVQPQSHPSRVRAYGEMVGMLWKARQYAAAGRDAGDRTQPVHG